MILRVAGVVQDSIVDGPGLRLTVFAQGCPHACPGCHNPHTWSFEGGKLMDTQELAARALSNKLCTGVTLSGGEPFAQASAMADLAHRVRQGGKSVWCYTGYTLEYLLAHLDQDPGWLPLLSAVDVLVDGPFVLAKRDAELLFRGSSNQRIIHLTSQKQ